MKKRVLGIVWLALFMGESPSIMCAEKLDENQWEERPSLTEQIVNAKNECKKIYTYN